MRIIFHGRGTTIHLDNTQCVLYDTPMNNAHPVIELAKRLRRAARNHGRLHLEPCHVAILMSADIYGVICAREAEEFRRACADAAVNDNSVGIIGFGSAQTTEPGASAGSDTATMELVSRGARLRLFEAMSEAQLRKKQSMH